MKKNVFKLSFLILMLACLIAFTDTSVYAKKDKKDKKESTESSTAQQATATAEPVPLTEETLITSGQTFAQYYFSYDFAQVIEANAGMMDETNLRVYQSLADAQALYKDYGSFGEFKDSKADLEGDKPTATITVLTSSGKTLLFIFSFDSATSNVIEASVQGVFKGTEDESKTSKFDKDALSDSAESLVNSWFDYDFKTAKKTFKAEISESRLKDYDQYEELKKKYGTLEKIKNYKTTIGEDNAVIVKEAKTSSGKSLLFTVNFDENSEIVNWSVDEKRTLKQTMQRAGLNVLMGMGIVFVVLLLIAFIISLFKVFFGERSKRNEVDIEEPKPKKAETPVETPATSENLTDDLELVAVIAAAIAASEGKKNTDGLVVRSIRRRK